MENLKSSVSPNLSDLCLCSLNIFSSIFLIQFLLKCASISVEDVYKKFDDRMCEREGGRGVWE